MAGDFNEPQTWSLWTWCYYLEGTSQGPSLTLLVRRMKGLR